MTTKSHVLDPPMVLKTSLVLLPRVCGLLHLQVVSRSRTGLLVLERSTNAQSLNQSSSQDDQYSHIRKAPFVGRWTQHLAISSNDFIRHVHTMYDMTSMLSLRRCTPRRRGRPSSVAPNRRLSKKPCLRKYHVSDHKSCHMMIQPENLSIPTLRLYAGKRKKFFLTSEKSLGM